MKPTLGFIHFFIILQVTSCLPNISNQVRTRTSNTSVNIGVPLIGQGYILKDNPIALTNDSNLSPESNLNNLVSVATITSNAYLTGGNYCYGLNYCFEVKAIETDATALQTQDGKWGFNTTSSEFLQVNSFYHISQIMNQFFSDLDLSYDLAYDQGTTPFTDSALPLTIKNSFQYNLFLTSPLSAYADCDEKNNAYFSAAKNALCFGYIENHSKMKWAQDSSVIYHETGHFLQHLQLNLNNDKTLQKSMLMGNFNYDEAGAIGEGLSDYFSYYINQRTHFAEWAAGRTLASDRPISEDNNLHVAALAKEAGRRLSYPDFLDYDPNQHGVPNEDIHLSGMIISHFLVALTEDLVEKCAFSKRLAQSQVMYLLNETMAELGDLNAKGTFNGSVGRINLSAAKASEWISKVNPINYRSFSQTFAKFLLNSLGNNSLNRCNGTAYSKEYIETLLDEYGLLLFRTYNENRNYSDHTNPTYQNTSVSSINRNKSVLIAKDLIKIDPTANAASAYIIDKRETILSGLNSLKSAGIIESTSEQTPSDLGFNNGNGRVSPGEIVGLALNLYNNSNSTMGNVQILANDWKTLGATGKPCVYPSSMANDFSWTTTAEGGEICNTVAASSSSDFQPICVMQYGNSTSTNWISQHSFRNKLALDSSYCLNKSDDRDCFIRALKGADQANFSKINPKKNWFQTMQDPNSSTAYSLSMGNIMLFEVSKHIPPGTTIDCRFRVRFTNCDDCYHNISKSYYDFTDTDYNGPTPFKIIHLQMNIVD